MSNTYIQEVKSMYKSIKRGWRDDEVIEFLSQRILNNEASNREIRFYDACVRVDGLIHNRFSRNLKHKMDLLGGY